MTLRITLELLLLVLQAFLVEKRRQEAVHQFGEEEREVGKDTPTENVEGRTTSTNVMFLFGKNSRMFMFDTSRSQRKRN